jgi:hypothetical protein
VIRLRSVDRLLAADPGNGWIQFTRDIRHRRDLFEILPPDAPEALPIGAAFAVGAQTLENAASILPQLAGLPGIGDALRAHAHLVIAGGGEGREFHPLAGRRFHRALRDTGIPAERVLLIQQSDSYGAQYGAWARDVGRTAPAAVLVWHHHLNQVVRRFAAAWADPAWRADRLAGIAGLGTAMTERRLVCMMNKVRAHRIVVLGRIIRRGWQGDGFVSCLGVRRRGDLIARGSAEEAAAERFPRFAEDIAAFEAIVETLPWRIEGDSLEERVFDDHWAIHRRAGLALVAESEMGLGIRRFTEKTLKPLLAGRPLLVAGNPGTLAQLRALGFETFAPLIDEAYDTIDDPQDRLAAVLAEAERLMGLTPPEWTRFLAAAAERGRRNVAIAAERVPARLDAALVALAGGIAAWLGGAAA